MQIDINKIADTVYQWSLDASEQDITKFTQTKEEDLVAYHNTLGRDIRNHFNLWSIKWEPEIVNGVDMSNSHPDAVSMDIIRLVWKRLNNIQ